MTAVAPVSVFALEPLRWPWGSPAPSPSGAELVYKELCPEKALIFRITHRDNIPWILDNGLHCCKSKGVEELTAARALVAELVRRYWVLGIECTLLEVQKLAYFLERNIELRQLRNTLDLKFQANRFGPYAPRLTHLLNALDGSYLHCDKRIADARPFDRIWFEDKMKDRVALYLTSTDAKVYKSALDATSELIDGFQSPLGMELLATVDWLLHNNETSPDVSSVREALKKWPEGAERKLGLFSDRLIGLALERLKEAA